VLWDDVEEGARLGLFERVVEGMVSRGMLDTSTLPPQKLDLDTTAFFDAGGNERLKLGLGSSAALTVALAGALTGPREQTGAVELSWVQALVELHRALQGGLGSGIDVAASVCGGVTGYELGAGGSVAGIVPIQWPQEIHHLCVWTGKSASTQSFLDRLQQKRASAPGGVDKALDRLGAVSERGVDALARNDPFRFLDAVDRFWEALDVLGRVIEMPIVSESHRLLRELGTRCGVHYKPSGAGGGDFGICFGTDEERIFEFSRCVREAGFSTPELAEDRAGTLIAGMEGRGEPLGMR
jgi:phosphomevalonate kinase